jgi:hypothetical protein
MVARNLSDDPGARPGRAHIVGPRSPRGPARLLAALPRRATTSVQEAEDARSGDGSSTALSQGIPGPGRRAMPCLPEQQEGKASTVAIEGPRLLRCRHSSGSPTQKPVSTLHQSHIVWRNTSFMYPSESSNKTKRRAERQLPTDQESNATDAARYTHTPRLSAPGMLISATDYCQPTHVANEARGQTARTRISDDSRYERSKDRDKPKLRYVHHYPNRRRVCQCDCS